jgi:hypothetical protein
VRDEFEDKVRRAIEARAGHRCSSPDCGAHTAGPQIDEDKAINVGVAGHITAASPGGPRFDATLSGKQRRSAENGIWLCQTHAKLVDNDPNRFTVETLRAWKSTAEQLADSQVGQPISKPPVSDAERKACVILPWKGKVITLAIMNAGKAVTLHGPVRGYAQVTVTDCNELFITMNFGDTARSIPLTRIDVSFDNHNGRLELQERQP